MLSEKRRIYFEKYRNRYSDLSRTDAPYQGKDKSNGNIPFYDNSCHVSYRHHKFYHSDIYGGLMAGLVEETTRYGVFKVLAKKRSLMTSDIVAYGFGHGLSEFILLGVMGLFTYIIALQAIHSGQTSQLPPLLVSQVNQLTGFAVVMSLFERLVALLLQVLLTAWDFLAVTNHKLSFYLWAILLHATIDFLAGVYQQGIVRNILLIEVMLAIYVLGVGLVTSQIWKKEETHGLI